MFSWLELLKLLIKQGCLPMKNIFFIFIIIFTLNFSYAHSDFSDLLEDQKEVVAELDYFDYHLQMLDLINKEIEVLGVNFKEGTIDLYLSLYQLKKLKEDGYNLNIKYYNNLVLAPDSEYKNPAEIEEFLINLNNSYPEITKLVSIGQSVEGRDIWAIKISDNPNIDETEEPSILFNSMHHAREVMTPEVAIDIAEYLASRYQEDDQVKNWVNSNEIWVLPMLNVDGNNKVWNGSTMWRKNVAGGHGVDINRNYPYKWSSCNGSSGSTWSQTYRGPEAGSEPETQALMGLISSTRPVFSISYHSYSELVLYPFGCRGEKTVTHDLIASIGKKLGDILDYTHGTPWEILYSVDGGDIDWMYAEYQVIPYVLELNSSKEGFQPSYAKWRDKTVLKNRPAWQYLLDRLDQSGVRGILKDKDGNIVTNFTVKVEKKTVYGLQLFQNYIGNPDGSFHVVLPKNKKYKLSFKVEGRGILAQEVEVVEARVNISPVLGQ